MKKYIALFLCALLILGLFVGCGASSKAYDMVTAEAAPAEEAFYAKEESAAMADSAYGTLTEEAGSTSSTPPESRKWIVTVYLSAETDDLDTLVTSLEGKIDALNGYVEDQSVYNGSTRANRRYRNADLTIRIPADQVDQFTEEVSGISNVISKEKHLEDVTLQYVATEGKVKALETEETRLLELLAKAETMSDLLEIEARLSDVRYELENYASQLRLYDNQIDYATIYLNISEVQEYTPVEEPTLWERITEGFSDSIEGLGESLQDVLVFCVMAGPYILVYGGILLILITLFRKLNRRAKERRAARKAARQAAKEAKKAAKKAAKEAKWGVKEPVKEIPEPPETTEK